MCARAHAPTEPHDAQSLYYQYRFFALRQRFPTWADAVAHCSAEVCEHWRIELQSRGQWSEPAEGVYVCADPPAESVAQVVDFVDADGDSVRPVTVAADSPADVGPNVSREILAGRSPVVRAIADAALDAISSAGATHHASARDAYRGAICAAAVAGLRMQRRGAAATTRDDAEWLDATAWKLELGCEAAIAAYAMRPPAIAQASDSDKATQLMLGAAQILHFTAAQWGASHAHAASACIDLALRYVLSANHTTPPDDGWRDRVVQEVADLVVRRVAEVQRGEAT